MEMGGRMEQYNMHVYYASNLFRRSNIEVVAATLHRYKILIVKECYQEGEPKQRKYLLDEHCISSSHSSWTTEHYQEKHLYSVKHSR